jgi:ABC-type antimicrobial peptide transport system permease subunit
MIFVYIILIAVGAYFWLMGHNVKKKKQVNIINEARLSRIGKEDRKEYFTTLGKGWEVIGVGFIAGAIMNLVLDTYYGWLIVISGVISGLFMMLMCNYRLQKKHKIALTEKEQKKAEQQQKRKEQQKLKSEKKKKK